MSNTKYDEKTSSITLDSESKLYEDISAMVNRIEEEVTPDDPAHKYLSHFRRTFEIFSSIYKKNISLIEKAQIMGNNLVSNASKIKAILDITSKDKECLSKLKEEYEQASGIIANSHESECNAKAILVNLRDQLTTLNSQVKRGEAFSFGEGESFTQIAQDVKSLRLEFSDGKLQVDKLSDNIENVSTQLHELRNNIDGIAREADRLSKGVQRYETQLKDLVESNLDASKLILRIKPEIKNQKSLREQNTKSKDSKIQNIADLKHIRHSILASLNSMKEEVHQIIDRTKVKQKTVHDIREKNVFDTHKKEDSNKTISERNTDIDHCNKELNDINDTNSNFSKQLESVCSQLKVIGEKKDEYRRATKSLRNQITNSIFQLANEQNEVDLSQRLVDSSQKELANNKRSILEESCSTRDAIEQTKIAKSEIGVEKGHLHNYKEKVLELFKEIDEKRAEKIQVDTKTMVAKDYVEFADEQVRQFVKELQTYKFKTEHQVQILECVRNEINNYKKEFGKVEQENESLRNSIMNLSDQMKDMTKELRNISTKVVDTHFAGQKTKAEIESYTMASKQCRELVQQTERVASRLQTEWRTLAHILNEAEQDRMQQVKELQTASTNFKEIKKAVHDRERKLDALKSDIRIKTAYLNRCNKVYRDKVMEISGLQKEMESMTRKYHILEQKRDRFKQIQYESHRASVQLLIEKQKTTALTYEFSIPRNIHRWDPLSAVDPGYVKNLRYRMILFTKLNHAHREYERLQNKKAHLEQELNRKRELLEKSLTVDTVKKHVARYQSALKEKMDLLKNMSNQARDLHPSINRSTSDLETLKEKVNKRKTMASVIHLQNIEAHSSYNANKSNDQWFLTESESYPLTVGGGYVGVAPQSIRREVFSDLEVSSSSAGLAKTLKKSLIFSPELGRNSKLKRHTNVHPLSSGGFRKPQ